MLDLFVLHPHARDGSMKEAGVWSAICVAAGLAFGGLLWAWEGGDVAQAYLAGYLIEKSLSLDNVLLIAAIFAAFTIPGAEKRTFSAQPSMHNYVSWLAARRAEPGDRRQGDDALSCAR